MKKSLHNVRISRLGYEELYQLGYQTADLMVTDSAELSVYGIDQNAVENLKTSLEDFKKRSFDQIYLLKQEVVTEEKAAKSDDLRKLFVQLEVQLRTDYGRNNTLYKMFDLKGIGKFTDTQLCDHANAVVNFVRDDFSSILKFVISPEMLEQFEILSSQLHELILKQDVAMKNRKLATQLRIQAANELYTEISKIRYIGKKAWAGVNSLKEEAYLMPSTRSYSRTSLEEDDDESFIVENPVEDEELQASESVNY